ncbi:MAG: hypothetical protein IPJ65_25630 [Archangiaceae bacterium]|nr:hypothetical protein [Archangiaceae bacterium]
MIFDAWVYGELELPPQAFTTWLSRPLGEEARGPDFVADDSGCVGKEPLVILEGLHQLNLTPLEFLGVGADFGRVTVRGLLRDDSVLQSQGMLTGLFASAAAHGGDGRLMVVGRRGVSFGYEVQVVCGAVAAKGLSDVERAAFLQSRAAADLRTLEAENRRMALELDLPNPGPTAPQWRIPAPPPAPPAEPQLEVPASGA